MNQIATKAIVLSRIDYGEADRIVTMLTPDHGKVRLMAKGVRRIRSKLAGGIELFSVSEVTFIRGRSDIQTLISARLIKHYGAIVTRIESVQFGYECLQLINRNTEEEAEADYFMVLERVLQALDGEANITLLRAWFRAQVLRIAGITPNLQSDTTGAPLNPQAQYTFAVDAMTFAPAPGGSFSAQHIKLLRIMFGEYTPEVLQKIRVSAAVLGECAGVVQSIFPVSLRI